MHKLLYILGFSLLSFSLSSAALASVELKPAATSVDTLGIAHTMYVQDYQGVPVFDGEVKVHRNSDTGVEFSTGHTVEDIDIDTRPTISSDAANDIAQDTAGEAIPVLNTTLYIFNEHLLNKLKPDVNVLVWEVELFQTNPVFHKYYYIDAHTGNIVYEIEGLFDAITRQIYDCSYMDGNCYIDETDPWTGYIYGRSEGQPERGDNPLWYIVSSLTDTDSLYNNLGDIYDYYLTTFGLDGANGNSGMGDGVYFPEADTTGLTYIDYYNADAEQCPNAFFDGIGSMHYCDGWVTNDISGHEYAHAVNYFTVLDGSGNPAGLEYTNEIGALNEANSDVFGEALEYYVTGSNDWLIGEDSPLGTLRSMSEPSDYTYTDEVGDAIPYPDRYNSENLYCGEGDSGGVHLNSSVVNKAAYLIAEGGTFNNCSVVGIGREKEEAIFYRAQAAYYTTTTDFNEAFTALLAACNDLYDLSDCKQVEKALRAVELNQAGYCSGEPAQDTGCAAVDAAPTIVSVSSDTSDGYYKANTNIDIDVTFSEAVSGNITLELETGDADQQCNFSVSNSTVGTCNYIVEAGDRSDDLNVKSITGTITDAQNEALTNTTPASNLSDEKNIVIDTTKPTLPLKVKIYTSPSKKTLIKSINPRKFSKIITSASAKPYFTWQSVSDANKYYVQFTNKKISKNKLRKTKNLRTARTIRGTVTDISKKYYLYMLLEDRAGNTSAVKKVVKYKTTL